MFVASITIKIQDFLIIECGALNHTQIRCLVIPIKKRVKHHKNENFSSH